MNFSALNTHAIGVQSTVSASAEVHEGAGSFSTGASVSAQAILHSHAVASAINSVALTTTQSVVRFARATASVGCSAAANVDGHRVKFSNAEIVCAANSAANAIVTHQAVASVAALGSVVALGSRVAFATASLQADARFTANSGGVIFVSATGITASAVCSSAASIESNAAANATAQAEVNSSAHCLRDLAATVTASSTLSSSSHVISRASGVFTGSSLAISVGEKRAVAHTTIVASAQVSADGSTGLFVSAQLNAQAIVSVASNVTHSVNASVIASSSISKSDTQTLIVTAAGGNLVIDGQSNKSLTLRSGSTYTFDLSDSSLSSHPLRFSTTSNGTHGGGTIFRGIINGVTVTGTQGQAGSFISLTVSDSTPASLYYFCLYHSGMGGAISVVSAADVSAEIFSHANASITSTALVSTSPNIDHFVSSSVIASSSVDSSASRIIDVSASVSGFALSISVGNKISVGHAQFTASATATSVCITKSSAEANASCSSQSSATASKVASGEAQVTASAIVSASSGSVVDASAGITCTAQTNGSAGNYIDVSASISSFAVSISISNKISVGHALVECYASLSGVARNDSNAQATAACNASVASSAIVETPVQAIALVSDQYTTVAAYTSYHDTTTTAEIGRYSPVPSFRSVVDNGGTPHYFSGVLFDVYALYQGADYDWTFASQYQNSTAPTEYSTWGNNGSAVGSLGGTRYKGASIGYASHQQFVNIGGMGSVRVNHAAASYKILEDTVTTHATNHPAVTTQTGFQPTASIVAECSVLTGSFAYPTGSAQLTTDVFILSSASAAVSASAGVTSTPVTHGLVFCTASVSASASTDASAGSHTLYTEVGTFAASSSVAASASIVHLVQASISSSSTTTAVGQRLIIASAPVTDTGYTAPSYDTTEDFLAAAYWERDDGQELVITGIWESIAPYSATTYSGNNYIATIRNTLNAGAAAGTSYVTSLSGVAYRDGLRGYNGSIKRRVTTTHPAVFVFTGTSPSAYVTADCTVFTSVQLYAYANASSTAVNTANAQGAFTGSSITISAGNGIVRVRAEVNASSNAVASANVESFVQGQVDATASASGSQYVESPASSVITASANTTSDTFIAVFATSNSITADAQVVESAVNTANAQGTFNGSSVTISAGDYSRVGRADFTASSELSASDFRVYAWREAHASASSSVLATDVLLVHVQADVIASASVLLDYQLNVHGQGDFVGSGAIVSASHVTPFAEFGVTSQALISADADYQRYGKANVVAQASVAVVGLGVNSASADLNSSADLTATPSILKIVSSTSVNAQANFVNGFAIVAQEGSRSNGILILVEAEDRSITVEAPDREFIAEAEIRIIFVDAA